MNEIQIIKQVEPCGKIWYLVKVDGNCQGVEKTLDAAECLAKKCEENIITGRAGNTVISTKRV